MSYTTAHCRLAHWGADPMCIICILACWIYSKAMQGLWISLSPCHGSESAQVPGGMKKEDFTHSAACKLTPCSSKRANKLPVWIATGWRSCIRRTKRYIKKYDFPIIRVRLVYPLRWLTIRTNSFLACDWKSRSALPPCSQPLSIRENPIVGELILVYGRPDRRGSTLIASDGDTEHCLTGHTLHHAHIYILTISGYLLPSLEHIYVI